MNMPNPLADPSATPVQKGGMLFNRGEKELRSHTSQEVYSRMGK